ncbi:OmpA family protein [Sulfurimonas sp. HSL-1716]|uniref:OmpA family protein n=1 Tax=Hydrocurvibacter sulfurireducens TaxID=3131937 RepID=UPI0031F8EF2B
MEPIVMIAWLGILIAGMMSNPTTTVVLADNGKAENAIVVKTKKGSVVLDKPGSYVSLSSQNSAPSSVKVMTKEQIQSRFKGAIASAPLKPISVLLYFKNDSNELTDESKAKLPQILKDIKDRMPCEVNIIGHTDTKGSAEHNVVLSLERANSVKEWIQSQSVDILKLHVESYGESNLLVPTGDNVSEEKNRRVELLIR